MGRHHPITSPHPGHLGPTKQSGARALISRLEQTGSKWAIVTSGTMSLAGPWVKVSYHFCFFKISPPPPSPAVGSKREFPASWNPAAFPNISCSNSFNWPLPATGTLAPGRQAGRQRCWNSAVIFGSAGPAAPGCR